MKETNEEIRIIKGKQDEEAYSNLSAYCFPDIVGWTSRIFPLHSGDEAYGLFVKNQLASGTIVRNFSTHIFNTLQKMSGIAAVVTAPQMRNQGFIRDLFVRILKDETEKGALVSALMPFKHKFYQKFGYGYFGGTTATLFEPANIIAKPQYEGEFVNFSGKEKELTAMYDVHDIWVQNYTGGIKSQRLTLEKFTDYLKWRKYQLFLYFKNNTCKAYILFNFHYKPNFVTNVEIFKAAWSDQEGLQGLLKFLKSHRDQVRGFEWKLPNNIPLQIMFDNPRISQQRLHDYMIRPLQIEKVLQLKAGINPVNEKITFSIEDPVIAENTGTYIIEGTTVEKIPLNGKNLLPFHIFSSLVFGGYSLHDALLGGLIDISFPASAFSFFQKDYNIFVSETF